MIVSCETMKEIEQRAFALGVTPAQLMEEAGRRIAEAVTQFFPKPGRCLVVYGKGHNGGDALVAARYLEAAGWEIALDPAFPDEALAPLTLQQLQALQASVPIPPTEASGSPTVILDGLLGIGAMGALREPIRSAARRINHLRTERGASVFALDLPSGLNGDTGAADPDVVVADFTLTLGFAKRGLLADGATDTVGRLAVLSLGDLAADESAREIVATPALLAPLLPRRRYDTHKGDYGRVGIVAGSSGFTGAALMAAQAAARAGAGLVSLHVTPDIYPIVAAQAAPEVMVAPVDCHLDLLEKRFDALAVGPGLGLGEADDIRTLIERFEGPMVVDADALNALASQEPLALLRRTAGPRLLTPHPGEFARLFHEAAAYSRRQSAEAFLAALRDAPVTLLLKGARTLVAESSYYSYNSTGHPGMASGGMGDVLTGVCAALLGQRLTAFDAGRLGAWLCGRAAELAVSHGPQSEASLLATDLSGWFGTAFRELQHRVGC